MFGFETIPFLAGLLICVIAALPLVFLIGQRLSRLAVENSDFAASQADMREEIRDRQQARVVVAEPQAWKGYRNFRVDRIQQETFNTTSLYLVSEDGKPFPGFTPGQHITLRILPKGRRRPAVRCYSLSGRPDENYYRISVRQIEKSETDTGKPGLVSSWLTESAQVGDRIEIKAPSGNFVLDEQSTKPIVLLAGGIGITPLLAMLHGVTQSSPARTVLLFYGVRNGQHHAFKQEIREINEAHPNVHVINLYSQPQPGDDKPEDYQVEGRLTVELLAAILPHSNYLFCLCGGPTFMESIYFGLKKWGVAPDQIAFEHFGPSTIQPEASRSTVEIPQRFDPVSFLASDEVALWDPKFGSLLELAESLDVPIESGCRSGSCGTCETALVSGKVIYPAGASVNCTPGYCLPCIARPDGEIELEV